jgi:hypothetical protein
MYYRKQSGQALPLGIAFLMSMILLGLVLFNTGQTASEKSRLINTADAAAYSGLIWQARALNYQAYTNRAMVANHVSVGQLVSLTSWTQYAFHIARNIDYIGDWFPIIKGYTQAAETVSSIIDSVMVSVAESFISINDSVNGVLSMSQQAVFAASFAATPGIVREVVDRNDNRYNVNTAYAVLGMGQNAVNWNNLTERYDDNDGLLRKADVVNRSKDEFTAGRNLRTSQLIPNAPNVLDLGLTRVWVKKEGTTRLISDESSSSDDGTDPSNESSNNNSSGDLEWEWKGKDTLSFHIEEYRCNWRDGCDWVHQEVPLGWGERYVNGDFECNDNQGLSFFGYNFSYDPNCPRYLSENRWAESLADTFKEALDTDYEGMRAYYDLQDLSEENKDPRLALRIEVELPQNQVRTASKINNLGSDSVPSEELKTGIGVGMFGTEDQMASGGLAAISSGELYFHPPDDYNPSRRTGRYEIASLFSPYWEVKLSDTSTTYKFMAWAMRDSSLLTDGASGIASGVQHYMAERAQELQNLLDLEQTLQNQISQTTDQAELAELQAELASVNTQISQLQNMNVNVSTVQSSLQGGIEQGLTAMAQEQVQQYEQMLEQYAQQQADNYVNQFEEQIVDEVTDQLQQAIERAVQEAIEGAINSMI